MSRRFPPVLSSVCEKKLGTAPSHGNNTQNSSINSLLELKECPKTCWKVLVETASDGEPTRSARSDLGTQVHRPKSRDIQTLMRPHMLGPSTSLSGTGEDMGRRTPISLHRHLVAAQKVFGPSKPTPNPFSVLGGL